MKISVRDYSNKLGELTNQDYEKMAKETGLSQTTIKYVLSKERPVSKRTYEAFKNAYDVEFTDYMVENEIMASKKILDDESIEILKSKVEEENDEIEARIRELNEKKKRNVQELEARQKLKEKYDDFNLKLSDIVENKDELFENQNAYKLIMKLHEMINVKKPKVIANVVSPVVENKEVIAKDIIDSEDVIIEKQVEENKIIEEEIVESYVRNVEEIEDTIEDDIEDEKIFEQYVDSTNDAEDDLEDFSYDEDNFDDYDPLEYEGFED